MLRLVGPGSLKRILNLFWKPIYSWLCKVRDFRDRCTQHLEIQSILDVLKPVEFKIYKTVGKNDF